MSIQLRRTWSVEGVLTDPTSVTLSNAAGTYGIKRNDTDVVVVAAGVAMTKVSTGVYSYTLTEPAAGLTYTAWIKVVYDGETYYFEVDLTGSTTDDSIATTSDVYGDLGITSPTTAEVSAIASALLFATGAVRRFLNYDPLQQSRTEYYPQQYFQTRSQEPVWEVNDLSAVSRYVSTGTVNDLQLKHLPIRSITSLYVDYDGRSGKRTGSFGASTLKSEGNDFWANYDLVDSSGNPVCVDGILRSVGSWPTVPGTVKVTYTAGYTQNELRGEDSVIDATGIWLAVINEASRRARRVLAAGRTTLGVRAGALSSENLGDYSYSVDGASLARLFGGDILPETKEMLSPFLNYALYL